jgi:hypothetical protein
MNNEDCGCAYKNSVVEPSGRYIYSKRILSVRHRRIVIDAVGYDIVQVVRLAVADPLRRQVAVDLPLRSDVSQAVAARSARLADAAHEPLLGYEAGVVDGPVGLLGLLPVFRNLSTKVLDDLPLVLLALVVVVEEHIFEVRRPADCSVEPLSGGVRELVVEDGNGFLDGAALEGVAGPAVVMNKVLC